MKIFKQKFTTVLLALAFLFGAASTVNFAMKTEAASQNVGDLTINYPGSPLFNASNIAPGYEETRTISVTNNGSTNHSFSIALDAANGPLANVLQFEPRALPGNFPIWNHTLAEIATSADGFVVFSAITPGQTVEFNLAAILPESVGNDYQGKSVQTFGIIMGSDFVYADNPPTIPVFGPSGGATTSAPAPMHISARSTTGATAETLATAEPKVEQKPGEVLGTTTETKGESTENLIVCYWWLILLIIFAVFLLIYGWIFNKKELMFDWVWPIVGGALLYIIHEILHRYYTPSKWCPYFIWIQLLMLLIYYIVYTYFKNRTQEEKK